MAVDVVMMCILLVVLLAAIVPSLEAIKCHHSLRNSAFNHTFDHCDGGFCYLLKDDENGLLIQGCVQGIPHLSERLQHSDSKWAWLCDTDLCNDNVPLTATMGASSDAVTSACVANATSGTDCRASKCWYQREKSLVQPGITATDERHSCKSFTGDPSYRMMLGPLTDVLISNACYHMLNDVDAAGEVLGQTVCSCTGDYCNRQPAIVDINLPEAIKLVTCRMSPQSAQSDVDIGAACKGQYCYLQRATINGYDTPIEFYTKGCFNATGARDYLDIGYRRFDQATSSEETWVCDWDDCNKSLREAASAKRTATTALTNDSISSPQSSSSSAMNESLPFSEAVTINPNASATSLPAQSSTESTAFSGTSPPAPTDQTLSGQMLSTSTMTSDDAPTESLDLLTSTAVSTGDATEASSLPSNGTASQVDEFSPLTTAKSSSRISFNPLTIFIIVTMFYSLLT